ncbi:helix-turn-helix transcriptional regulator [Dyadobacter frigoris]|uniref:Helix-turn-helix transcriptional regulator n=2 Tax=Dyadobacter frigoris TaxID=2576211 RepID=A0A4U6D827_9BACT|nr:helix-turn-helix transcriptional regulator [Dyadobacter frigoris]
MIFSNQNCCRMTAEEALQTYYKKREISQPEIAFMLEVSQTTVHNWLSGKHKIPIEFYDRIAKLCNIDLIEILPEGWRILLDKEKQQ